MVTSVPMAGEVTGPGAVSGPIAMVGVWAETE